MKNFTLKSSSRILASILVAGLCSFNVITAQSYTYETESFEDAAWASHSGTVISSTGEWTINSNNIQSDAYAQDGTYCVYFANKNGIITPKLENGAAMLTFYINKPTGGGRTYTVATSVDNITYNNVTTAIGVSIASGWVKQEIEINDATIRYIKIITNSNSNVYIDEVSITKVNTVNIKNDTAEEEILVSQKHYDLLGRPIKTLVPKTIYIQENVYENGSIKINRIINQ